MEDRRWWKKGGGEPPRDHMRVDLKKKRPVPNATRWGAFMFDSWMIPSGGGFLY